MDRQIWGEQKWLSPCTKPASEAEILVPTIVKLSNRCQSDQNHLVSTNIAGAKKMVSTNIAAGKKIGVNKYCCWCQKHESPPKNHESPSCCKKMLKKNPF